MTTILFISDSTDFLDATVTLLAFAGFNVIEASDGATGVQLAERHQPDAILCDMMMAEMNGQAVHQALQTSTLTANIPFIFLTATQESVLPKGVSYLPKPFKLDALRRALDAAMNE